MQLSRVQRPCERRGDGDRNEEEEEQEEEEEEEEGEDERKEQERQQLNDTFQGLTVIRFQGATAGWQRDKTTPIEGIN